jgi:AcrR family transcriptional regulator
MDESAARTRNRRGEGGRLRADILAAATALLEETGSEEAVTLRAVARGVGIAAPSIYAHFPDRTAIVDAVVDQTFHDFTALLRQAVADESDPAERLRRGCAAYLEFAETHPQRYRILFDRREPAEDDPDRPIASIRKESFEFLADAVRRCADAGVSASTDPFGDATAIWVALHGYATLRANMPRFPWPPHDATLDRIVHGLARIAPR